MLAGRPIRDLSDGICWILELDQAHTARRVIFTAAVWCVPALRVPLVHSQINHFRQSTTLLVTGW